MPFSVIKSMATPKSPASLVLRAELIRKTIRILFAPDQKEYTIHETVLAHHSWYFRNALRRLRNGADNGVVPLENVEVETFELFAQWAYTQQLSYTNDVDGEAYSALKDSAERDKMVVESFWRYMKAYVFGDRYRVHGFRRAVQDMFSREMEKDTGWTLSAYGIRQYAFDNIPAYRPLL